MSTSPTKGDGVLPPPGSSTRLGPPNGRRGHAHRRSGAISCHDLQTILQPTDANANPRGGSAPVTPFENEDKIFFAPQSRRSISQTDLKTPSTSQISMSEDPESSLAKVVPRMRVGFSERVEYIRPLSTISSETESSMSTIRGHSVNNSLSSVLSTGAASPSSVKMGRPSLQTTFEDEYPCGRPSTADDVLQSLSLTSDEFGGALTLPERPRTAAATESPTATTPPCGSPVKQKSSSKKRHFPWFEQRRNSRPLSASIPASLSEPSLVVTPPDTPAIPPEDGHVEGVPVDERALAINIDGDRKPRKVRSWAHSLIPLRHKPKTPTEEVPSSFEQQLASPMDLTPNALEFNLEANFDGDNTVDIVTSPSIQSSMSPYDSRPGTSSTPSDDSFGPDAASPIIDLDAALGPFNTPTGSRSPQMRASQSRRSMYSGGFSSNLQGFTQQHRRTESAPELAPFDMRMKMSSTSTMADVFEEDEEDEYDYRKPAKPMLRAPKPIAALSDSSVPTRTSNPIDRAQQPRDRTFGTGLSISNSVEEPEHASESLAFESAAPPAVDTLDNGHDSQSSAGFRDPSPVEVVEDYEEPRASSLTKDSDSTITPTLTEDETKQPPPLMNLNLPVAPPSIMTPDTFSSSPLSTPDYVRGGRISFETPRLGTAASSITDTRTINSYILGEPGPEYRMSVDDVPSLTSSRSTMTSPQHPMTQHTSSIHDTRSVSVSSIPSAGAERTRKRASIGSLSRLMGGAAGKSKLSIESRPQSEHGLARGEEGKTKKRNRISRLMTFWKNKEQFGT